MSGANRVYIAADRHQYPGNPNDLYRFGGAREARSTSISTTLLAFQMCGMDENGFSARNSPWTCTRDRPRRRVTNSTTSITREQRGAICGALRASEPVFALKLRIRSPLAKLGRRREEERMLLNLRSQSLKQPDKQEEQNHKE